MAHEWEQPRWHRRPLRLLTAAVGAIALGAVLLGRGGPSADDPLRILPEATAEPGAAATARLEQVPGGWVGLGDAPLAAPPVHIGVWTGAELVVGFAPEVAAYDPSAATWRTLPGVPGPARPRVAVLAAGRHIALIGGAEARASAWGEVLLLDPEAGRWEALPPPPAAPLAQPALVWTGTELILWGGARPHHARALGRWPVQGSAYRPSSGAWRVLPPAPLARVHRSAGVWTGREMVVWGGRQPPAAGADAGSTPFAAAYDPATDRWRLLPAPPFNDPATAATVWTGAEVILLGAGRARGTGRSTGAGGSLVGVALRPGTSDAGWRVLAALPAAHAPPNLQGVATTSAGGVAVVYGGYSPVGLLYDPSTDCWLALPLHRPRGSPLLAWTGSDLLLWGGLGHTARRDLWAYRPPVGAPLVPRGSCGGPRPRGRGGTGPAQPASASRSSCRRPPRPAPHTSSSSPVHAATGWGPTSKGIRGIWRQRSLFGSNA
jgi:hypothetical protein